MSSIQENCGASGQHTASSCGQNRNVHISETIIVSLVWLLGSLLRSVPSLGEKPGTTSVSELSAAPILSFWPELKDWQCYSHVAAIASNACHTIIAPSFIPPDTAGGAFNCSFGAGVWSLQVPACQMDTAASTPPVWLNGAYLRNRPTQQMQERPADVQEALLSSFRRIQRLLDH